VDHQSVWFGVAVAALLWAYLPVLRTRRALNQVQQGLGVQQGSSASSAVAELTGSVTQ